MEDGSRPAARVAAEQDRQAVRAVRAGLGGRGDREPAHAGHSGGPGACQRGCVRGRGLDCRCGSQLCAEPVGMAPDRQAAHAEGDAAVLGRVRRRLAGPGPDQSLRERMGQVHGPEPLAADPGRGTGLPSCELRDVRHQVRDLPLLALRRSRVHATARRARRSRRFGSIHGSSGSRRRGPGQRRSCCEHGGR